MNDKNDQKIDNEVDPEWEMRLAREVRALDMEIQPARNLWPGIERKIEAYPQSNSHPNSHPKRASFTSNWMQLGVAASFLMAFSALVLTVADINSSENGVSQVAEQLQPRTFENGDVENSTIDYPSFENPSFENPSFENPVFKNSTLETMQVEYHKTRDPLVERFTETNRDLAPETLEELYRNIEIMAQARLDIEAQVRRDPTNRRLVEQLMRIHQQELALLKQDFSQPIRSM